jgi:hypothetical protein
MTTNPHVIVATADDVGFNRWVVQGRAAGVNIQVVSDAKESFGTAVRELEALHGRIHRLNGDLGFLTEKVSMMCLRLVDALGQEKSDNVPSESSAVPQREADVPGGRP